MGETKEPRYCKEPNTTNIITEPDSTRMNQPSTMDSISKAQEVAKSAGH
jgi:hypothetical protein